METYKGESDPSTDPETGVMYNRFEIQDKTTLECVEATFAY